MLKKGHFGALLGGYLLGVFYAPEKVALAVAIRHKKRPKRAYLLGFGAFSGGVIKG